MSFTTAQERAIAARGNVLVVAGAGTGKTRTLVERCLRCLTDGKPRASLEELLLVTFTEAAAAEMRQRIRARLEQELERRPGDGHWQEQLALFETAHIGTLHSFCLRLVREHFYELELDPQLGVLAEEEACLLAEETLDSLLRREYAGRDAGATAVQSLIQTQGRGWDKPIRNLVLKLHRYSQTLPNPAAWLKGQLTQFSGSAAETWQPWLLTALAEWRERWLPPLEAGRATHDFAAQAAESLSRLPTRFTRLEAAAVLPELVEAGKEIPRSSKIEIVRTLRSFLDETRFLASLCPAKTGVDPLEEDWNWVRAPMSALVRLASDFTGAFTDAKRELGMVDFQDLEQYALSLLWDDDAHRPSKIAEQWRARLRFVFVDEYQDINAAQDNIIQALSREGPEANRFLVGDVKQSIYRFRLANPRIFQAYIDEWGAGPGQAIPLVENFRSREGVLNFINSLFTGMMRRELGGVPYDEQAMLRFGALNERRALSAGARSGPCVELHLRIKGRAGANGEEDAGEALEEIRDLEEAGKEARLVALRLRELKAQGYPVWDERETRFRPVDWSDMALLLRSPSNKADSYAKEFSRVGVPLQVSRGGFFQNLEISDLLSLLHLLDNPLQDLPAIAVLHSPLVGLTVNELAAIRLAVPQTRFWNALVRWNETERSVESEATRRRVSAFLERFGRWRRLARQVSLSRCLDAVLAETHFADWLLTQPRGEQRHANVRRLLGLAEQFDQFQRQGLFRLLRFIEAQQLAETEPEVAALVGQNTVRLISIHQSKGLEFPVVVAADLGKSFNLADLRAELILDEEFGLCPQIKPPHTGRRYPSLPYWLARRRQKKELWGEELRLLYVALTRARDLLVLAGSTPRARFEKLWQTPRDLSVETVLAATSYADWLGLWFGRHVPPDSHAYEGENALLRWTRYEDADLLLPDAPGEMAEPALEDFERDPELWSELQQRLAWQYPFSSATRQPAKSSVSALRRRAADADLEDSADGSPTAFRGATHVVKSNHPKGAGARRKRFVAGAAEVGTAHHAFLQHVRLERTGNAEELREEARRLQRENALKPQEVDLLDFESLAAFWNSELGRRVRLQSRYVQRELPFTARFPADELARFTGETTDDALGREFVVVQGVADLAVLLPAEIWLVDFKTDTVSSREVAEKMRLYQPQLALYAQALAKIYQRPVTQCWIYFLSADEAQEVVMGCTGGKVPSA